MGETKLNMSWNALQGAFNKEQHFASGDDFKNAKLGKVIIQKAYVVRSYYLKLPEMYAIIKARNRDKLLQKRAEFAKKYSEEYKIYTRKQTQWQRNWNPSNGMFTGRPVPPNIIVTELDRKEVIAYSKIGGRYFGEQDPVTGALKNAISITGYILSEKTPLTICSYSEFNMHYFHASLLCFGIIFLILFSICLTPFLKYLKVCKKHLIAVEKVYYGIKLF